MKTEPSEIKLHTLAWAGDRPADDLPEANAQIYVEVEINGQMIPGVIRARTLHRGDGFATCVLTLVGNIITVPHTQESWDALGKDLPA